MSQKSTNFGAMAYEYMISEQLDPSKGTTHAFVLSDVRRFLAEIAPFETKLSIIRDQFFDEFSSKKDDVIADFTRQFERLESAYKASKELTEPIEYWETKRRRHRRTAFVFLVFLGGVGFAIYCLWEMAFEMLTKNTSVAVAATETSEAVARVDPPLWLLGLVASISLVIIWIIKILVRLLLSNIHLAEDADERIVLINTYITMLRMDGVSAGSAKEKLYDSIFRTASTGLIHGDGMPNLLHTKVINKVIDDS
ncbi:hypothetical protein COB72_10980 [bacterium]|nr:MAG: hypothetical protein COB72_10980 [bacterium]